MAQPEDVSHRIPTFTEQEKLPGTDTLSATWIAVILLETVEYPELVADDWALALQILQGVWQNRRLKHPALYHRRMGGVLAAKGCVRIFIESHIGSGTCGPPLRWEYGGVDEFGELHLDENWEDLNDALEALCDIYGNEAEAEAEAGGGDSASLTWEEGY
ncbi:hypothetical protein ASPACDRAFT_63295 [Aspergillus aculeatus ATCC 16872]|uniref:Uncharacterized protein n=1 Tax=Aspergillus aculeatus (strain ATCC 16872 / CBS 172.66 / WB 5094) TaxID=690307 RepID=A0A1L9WLF5_ASPA1|nr:uncharacterized protein ASPACDRAFT_63295 [Aspergillus aculeatus ATCC 16872]OJJ96987.1 hypothetical protein ASPACDRAFT_63295 [Aspergillus aculeatus ATCC 16872]